MRISEHLTSRLRFSTEKPCQSISRSESEEPNFEVMEESSENAQNLIQQQETQLKSKYGNLEKKRGSAMLNKKLRGSSKKYFDSGDYIMERDRSVSKPMKNRPPQLVLKDIQTSAENLPPVLSEEGSSPIRRNSPGMSPLIKNAPTEPLFTK
ncbi:Oidioi.mRNA.OKI2018_I69.PAR.g12223.t2.cds [Oikopleura dioica]|uniref:Oidioi.mRNA.OKI2018_I69.PAR.g12223.t2.cds n=1 Tax=Oikopleura dioica TaxID=34765 RepID=A0ABN7S6P6_OIKDI|nr:Oidioi.mRNA.OKI2018_I69.PAR.g12223.t2.cds [Oikopleura dioica]